MIGEAVSLAEDAAVGGRTAGAEVVLHVGPVLTGVLVLGVDPGQALDAAQDRHRPAALEDPLDQRGQAVQPRLHQTERRLDVEHQAARRDVVLQVPAHAGQVRLHLDAQRPDQREIIPCRVSEYLLTAY